MPYFPPFIDAAGLHIPTLADITGYELEQFLSVYGNVVNTGNDSSDVQWISIFSLMIFDAFNTAQIVYNARSPLTAVGADLDAVCKINGIYRKSATPSTVTLTISGVAATVITNGVAQDTSGFLWDLPSTVIIPNSGTIAVTATCETYGPISAQPNTIITRSNPTAGWNSVNNAAAAIIGQPQETDSQLRARQAISSGIASKTLVTATLAAIAAIANVTRWNPGTPTPGGPGTSIENPTGGTDSWGNPAHSVSFVVEGGTDLDIATAIYDNKTPGAFTNGTTTVAVTDPTTLVVMDISFFRPTYIPIFVAITLHPLTGFTSADVAAVQNALVAYLNSLQIGESLTISALYGAALAVMPNLSQPQFSITALKAAKSDAITTAVVTAGSPIITVTSGAGIVIGQTIIDSGLRFPSGTTVIGVSGTTITLSNNATTNDAVDTVTFFTLAGTDIAIDFDEVVQGALENVAVTVV